MISQRQLFLQHQAQTSPSPLMLEIVKAGGIYLEDREGKKYIDFISGISVSNIGHCHPEVIAAIEQQAKTYMHLMVYGEYVQSPQVLLAKALTDLLPPSLNSVYFVNSGAEATEGAMKLAKRYTGRTEIVCFKNAYHGSTQGALSVMGNELYKQSFRPLLPGIRIFDFNSEEQLELLNENTACVMIELIQGEAGVIPAEINFIQKLRALCSEKGIVLIIDEIQTGFGRTGTLFALEQYEIVPDILLLAKGMGGGMPVGAFIADRKMMNALTHNPVLGHITTFGGNAVCCAAALANLKVIREGNLEKRALQIELIIRNKLSSCKTIKAIRGKGAFLALDFEQESFNFRVIEKCIQYGLITDWFLFCAHAMRIAPPLTIEDAELERSCEIILKSISEAGKRN